ncbi:hypothetical protein CC80DRAFT_554285 [Byssothecium circinans]|uniref:DUF6594 domain-containing protein n=1 Tax=Byssothecium circinans TaxID=147558 RepID=A0A6A5TFI5_9PLEO|nr:hypothetical protein CC80DRAFT_554285 [Byssothecium circinans]
MPGDPLASVSPLADSMAEASLATAPSTSVQVPAPVAPTTPYPTPTSKTTPAAPVASSGSDDYPFADHITGYPRLAGRMGAIPEIAMFRRFGALNARNLLYLQNDLVVLENELKQLEIADSQDDLGKKKMYAFDSAWLSTADFMVNGMPRDGDTRQRDLQSTILQMNKPDAFDLNDIQRFLSNKARGP